MSGVFLQRADDDAMVWGRHGPVRARELQLRARELASRLEPHGYYVNACESRAAFMIGFLAALERGATLLLPSQASAAASQALAQQYPDHGLLTDALVNGALDENVPSKHSPPFVHAADAEHRAAAIVFTSGSTGAPQGHAKRWLSLVRTAELACSRLIGAGHCNLVATMPSQHMYGFEAAIMMVLAGRCAVADGRPFFPRDIAETLATIPPPRALITTPAHLRACVGAQIALPELTFILSATAPLPDQLAVDAEALWHAPVREIYGCTEAGTMATRRTLDGDIWLPLPGTRFETANGAARYCAPHLPEPVELQDVLEPAGAGVRLIGRSSDLVKIAGKRASLADLTQQLLGIDGVIDGVIFMPQPDGRCAALVVAPGRSREEILGALAQRVDAAFLPRPLRLVACLPRNDSGKLPRDALLAALGENIS
ncbi:MAG TPA: AMP-binding protein [Steroidobacteraceae bacterium]|nr:AMP-binding protein [Steroidobacteraceae bacterium]